MKKKILLVALMVVAFTCFLAISVSAQALSNFINVDLTLNDGSQVEAYLTKGGTWNGYQGYDRVTIYADYTDTSKTISWSDVKVFDGRNSTIHTYDGETLTDTGAYAQTLLGYQTGISSVTHFYYTQGSVIVADNSFGAYKKWNLEYLYVPKSVKILGKGICASNTNLTTVEIEAGSQLEEIWDSAFKDCTALTSINLQDTKLKELSGTNGNTIDNELGTNYGNVFRGCTALTSIQFPPTLEYIGYNAFYLSGLSGKVALPNSVTYVGPGSFLCTRIETLVLGDGPVLIGFNVAGNYSSFNSSCLKEVYIPSEATFEKPAETWRKSTNQVTFYVIGDDCTTVINSLKSAGSSNHISIGMASDANAQSYGGVIVEGVSSCTAFYNGTHTELSAIENNTCQGICSRCNEVQLLPNPVHKNAFTESFTGERYFSSVSLLDKCENCSEVALEESLAPIFYWVGYSAKTFGDLKGFGQQYVINRDALEKYQEIMTAYGKKFSYGVVAAGVSSQGQPLEVVEGVAAAKTGAQSICFDQLKYDAFFMNIVGIDNANLDTSLVCCAYVQLGDEIVYLDNNQAKDTAGFLTYNIVAGLPETKGDEE